MFDESSKTDLVSDYIICLFYPLDVYQIQKSGTAANEASVLLRGSHHNNFLAPSAVTTTTAVLHDEEDEEDMDKSAVSRQQRSHSDTTVVLTENNRIRSNFVAGFKITDFL